MTAADERAEYIKRVVASAPPIRSDQITHLRTALLHAEPPPNSGPSQARGRAPDRAKAPAATSPRRPRTRSDEQALMEGRQPAGKLAPATDTTTEPTRSPKRSRRAGQVA